MFGTFRTLLSILVTIGHLFGPVQLGIYAVFGFYILSGFLMTTIMHESYSYTFEGRKKYLINRFLRIYPTYWFTILISICIFIFLGDDISSYSTRMYLPNSFISWIGNILLLFSSNIKPHFSTPAWTLTVELFFYLAICCGISKSKKITLAWLTCSLIYTVYLLITEPNHWQARYSPIQAASLPFSIGSSIYYYQEYLKYFLEKIYLNKPLLWFAMIILNFRISFFLEKQCNINFLFTFGMYINLIIMVFAITSLIDKSFPLTSESLDKKIGSISYSIYLHHLQIGALLYVLYFKNIIGEPVTYERLMTWGGFMFLISSLVVIILLSFFVVWLIDDRVDILRKKIKNNQTSIDISSAQ